MFAYDDLDIYHHDLDFYHLFFALLFQSLFLSFLFQCVLYFVIRPMAPRIKKWSCHIDNFSDIPVSDIDTLPACVVMMSVIMSSFCIYYFQNNISPVAPSISYSVRDFNTPQGRIFVAGTVYSSYCLYVSVRMRLYFSCVLHANDTAHILLRTIFTFSVIGVGLVPLDVDGKKTIYTVQSLFHVFFAIVVFVGYPSLGLYCAFKRHGYSPRPDVFMTSCVSAILFFIIFIIPFPFSYFAEVACALSVGVSFIFLPYFRYVSPNVNPRPPRPSGVLHVPLPLNIQS